VFCQLKLLVMENELVAGKLGVWYGVVSFGGAVRLGVAGYAAT
jgi:hypothetical protein